MSILLTGAAGFIGQHFAASQHFLQKRVGDKLVCVDKLVEPPEGLDSGEYVTTDLTSVNAVVDLIKQVRPLTVVHLAGATKVGESGDLNTAILSNLFHAILETNIQPQVVLAGSAAEYGDTPEGAPAPKEGAPLQPKDPYARSKVICSTMAERFAETSRCPVTVARFANVYGPGQVGRFVPLVINAVFKGEPVVLHAMGMPRRQFVYVQDICRALWAVVEQRVSGVFNFGGDELSAKEVSYIVGTAVHDLMLRRSIMPKPIAFDLRLDGGGAMRVVVDSTKAFSEISWTPRVNIYDGMRRTAADQLQGELENHADRILPVYA